jgi:hypothetical protein
MTFVLYGHEKFYNIGPRSDITVVEHSPHLPTVGGLSPGYHCFHKDAENEKKNIFQKFETLLASRNGVKLLIIFIIFSHLTSELQRLPKGLKASNYFLKIIYFILNGKTDHCVWGEGGGKGYIRITCDVKKQGTLTKGKGSVRLTSSLT